MPIPPEILVVSCHPQHCKPLVVALDKMGIRVSMVFSAEEAARALTASRIPVVCSCAELPDGNYRSVLKIIQSKNLKTRLLVMSAAQECAEYLHAMQAGTFDFLPVPYQMGEVERIVRKALEFAEPIRAVAGASPRQT